MSSVYNKYPAWSDFGGKRVLNVGCGFAQYKRPNVVNLDAYDSCRPDVVWDLNKTPYPFESGSFDLIIANHIMEHLPNWWGAVSECARLLKTGGILEIWVPGNGSDAVFGFRDHVAQVNGCGFYGTFGTYREAFNAWAVENTDGDATWLKMHNQTSVLEPRWWLGSWVPVSFKQWCWRHLRNVCIEDAYMLRKVSRSEWEAERREFERRTKERRDQFVQVPQVQPAGVAGGL